MDTDAVVGVSGDAPRDGVESPSRAVAKSFFGEVRQIPAAHGSVITTPVHVYFSGERTFCVHFGDPQAEMSLWTDERGLEAIIGSCQAVLVRARIAREAAARPVGAPFDEDA